MSNELWISSVLRNHKLSQYFPVKIGSLNESFMKSSLYDL